MKLYTEKPENIDNSKSNIIWDYEKEDYPDCVNIIIKHKFPVKRLAWHYKYINYFLEVIIYVQFVHLDNLHV